MLPPLFFVALGVLLLLVASALSFNVLCQLRARSWLLIPGVVKGYRYDKSYGGTIDGISERFDDANSNTTTQLEVEIILPSAEKHILIIPNLLAALGQTVMLRVHPRWPQLLHYPDEALELRSWRKLLGTTCTVLLAVACISLSLVFFRIAAV
jgi:hypothetical protein